MTPLLPTPDHYLHHLITMSSSDAKRLWRQAIKESWNCRCAYCHQVFPAEELTLDHVRPRTRGGGSETRNLVPSCITCNRGKASNNWLTWMRETFGLRPDREHLILNWIS